MDFDTVLEEIGEFGKYQITTYLLLSLPVFFGAANSLSYVFTAGEPNYRCLIPECDDLKNPVYDAYWVTYAVPGSIEKNGVFSPEQCEFYQSNSTHKECSINSFSEKILNCNEWVFDNVERTIVNDWLITCSGNKWKLALVGTIHFAGIVVGSAISGVLADRYGRKLVFVLCILFMAVTGVGQALSPNYDIFLLFAFLNAVGTSGVYPLAFIIAVEMVGRQKREIAGIALNYFYALGEAAVGLVAWLSRDWVVLQLVVSVPPVLFVSYYWLIPESVRWLLAKHDVTEAGNVIKKAAKINGVILSEALLSSYQTDEQVTQRRTDDEEAQIENTSDINLVLKALFTSKILIFRCIILFYIWATNALVYYGLSLNSTNLSGNKYLNFTLVCLVEIPGYTIAWLSINKYGRRWPLSGSFLLCGITCIVGGFIGEFNTWALISLFLTGKLGITASFAIIYVHTAEMLPTIIRSGGVGAMSMFARLGAMVAPFVPLLGSYYKPLPLVLFGGISLLAGILALFLPETKKRKLPETVEEAEKLC